MDCDVVICEVRLGSGGVVCGAAGVLFGNVWVG